MISKKRTFKVFRLFICLAVILTASSLFMTIEPMASENSDRLLPVAEEESAPEIQAMRADALRQPVGAERAARRPLNASQSVDPVEVDIALQTLNAAETEVFQETAAPVLEDAASQPVSQVPEESAPISDPAEPESSHSNTTVLTPEPPVDQTPAPEPSAPSIGYSDLDYLAAICQIEAGYNYDGCLAVANVILNRVNSGSFPSSIRDVIYQPYQFATGWMESYLQNGTGSPAREAAAAALAGSNNIGSYLYFNGTSWLNPDTLGRPYVVIGGNCFY